MTTSLPMCSGGRERRRDTRTVDCRARAAVAIMRAQVIGRHDQMQLAAAMGRLGTESAFEVLARATRLQREGRSIINLGIGQPDFPTPPNIVEAAVRALKDGHHGYTPANGILALREAVAEDVRERRGVEVHPDRVVVVPGGKVTMAFAIMMFGEPG